MSFWLQSWADCYWAQDIQHYEQHFLHMQLLLPLLSESKGLCGLCVRLASLTCQCIQTLIDFVGEVEAKENKGNLEGPRQNSPPRQPFRASQAPHQQQPWGQPQPPAKPWAQIQPQQHPWDPPQPARHQWGQAASQTREAANPWGQQQPKAVMSTSCNQAIMLRTPVA